MVGAIILWSSLSSVGLERPALMLILRHPIDALSGALLLLVLELVSLNGIGHLTGPYEISGGG